jgi:ribosomal protein S27AE
MIVDILTLNVSCPRCTQKFAETTWYPLSRALEDPDNREAEDVILATCPRCGCTICVSVEDRGKYPKPRTFAKSEIYKSR